jgi:hypothetical protein
VGLEVSRAVKIQIEVCRLVTPCINVVGTNISKDLAAYIFSLKPFETSVSYCNTTRCHKLEDLKWNITTLVVYEELHDSCASPNVTRVIKSRRMRCAGHVARMGEMKNSYNILVGKPEGKRSFGRPRRRWEDNIGMDFWEVGWERVDWMHLAQDGDWWRAVVNTVMKFWAP